MAKYTWVPIRSAIKSYLFQPPSIDIWGWSTLLSGRLLNVNGGRVGWGSQYPTDWGTLHEMLNSGGAGVARQWDDNGYMELKGHTSSLYCSSRHVFFAAFADVCLHLAIEAPDAQTKVRYLQEAKGHIAEAVGYKRDWADSQLHKDIDAALLQAQAKREAEKKAKRELEAQRKREAESAKVTAPKSKSVISLANIASTQGAFATPASLRTPMTPLAFSDNDENEIRRLEALRDGDDTGSLLSDQSIASSQFYSQDKTLIAEKLQKRIREKGKFTVAISDDDYVEVSWKMDRVSANDAKIMQQTLSVLFCKPNALTKVSETCWRINWAALRDTHVREFKQKYAEQSLLVNNTFYQSAHLVTVNEQLTIQKQQQYCKELLTTVSSLLAQHANDLPRLQTGFISYSWYTDIEVTKKLQARLKLVVESLRILGLDVHLDIQRMHGNIDNYMTTRINNSEVIFVIGTPALVPRLTAAGPNNLKTEYNHIRERQRTGNCLVIPLLLEGEHATSFPIERDRPWLKEFIYDLRQLEEAKPVSCIESLAGLESPLGLIPTLWKLRERPHLWTMYQNAYELFQLRCQQPLELKPVEGQFKRFNMS